MNPTDRVFIAGHRGLAGSAILRRLQAEGFSNLVTRGREKLDLTDAAAVRRFFHEEKPEYVFLAAARVGGILANHSHPVAFLQDNLAIELSVIRAAFESGVRKLLFLGSSCVYPANAPQPMREEYLLTGPLEVTNQWYAIAKIAGLKLCEAYHREFGREFISVMPANLYGPGDNFDPGTSHVLPALMGRFHEARQSGHGEVVIWGTGKPLREFLYVDDLADACVFVMRTYTGSEPLNVGSGQELSIAQLGEALRAVTGFDGSIAFDPTRPDGVPRKLLDSSRLTAAGWRAGVPIEDGIRRTYDWFRSHAQGSDRAHVTAP